MWRIKHTDSAISSSVLDIYRHIPKYYWTLY